MLSFLRKKKGYEAEAADLYVQIVEAARRPVFYRDLGVPDTTDGRFEMIVLCGFFVFWSLKEKASQEAAGLSQALFDRMFSDMDRSLRESGVGDLGVPRHMKRMMTGFNGRMAAYEAALALNGDEALLEALKRNVYGTVKEIEAGKVESLARYVRRQAAVKQGDLLNGRGRFEEL